MQNNSELTRPLTPSDLGIKGNVQQLIGSLSIKNKVAIVRIDMIQGQIYNPLQVLQNLSKVALDEGAETLRIEAIIANEKLYNILERRYGLVTINGLDVIVISLI